ncbi:MAG: D-alanyl-D-alanine carboxypeptidase family protein [Oscillospiraceae bacterium]|nr:D-alanyl-D-alanine carboxypeptidase family protein [Oscillospiraceae bacterium]
MKRKGIAVFLTAMMMPIMLGGCSERGAESVGNVTVNSAVTLPDNSTGTSPAASAPASTSTHSGAPSVIAPSFSDTSSDEPETSVPEVQTSTPTEPVTPTYPTSNATETITDDTVIESGRVMYVDSGEVLELNANVAVQPGGAIVVNEGGELLVAKYIELDGDLELRGNGKLTMLYDSAIEGGGDVIVGKSFNQIDCGDGTIKAHITPPEREIINGATYVGGIVIANKAITLPPEFGSHIAYDSAEPVVLEALQKMNAESPYYYSVVSGYRDYWSQQAIFQRYCDRDGYEEAVTYSAKQGHSEHQTGYTMDLDSLYESYGQTPEGKWLAANCWKYGFIIRYPKGKENITGYTYEPWHVRWIGRSTAKLVYDSGLTLEEFFNVEGGWTIID